MTQESLKRQDLEVLWDEVLHRVNDHSFLLRFSHEMFRYDVHRARHDYLQRHFDHVHERIVAFFSSYTSPIETTGKIFVKALYPSTPT